MTISYKNNLILCCFLLLLCINEVLKQGFLRWKKCFRAIMYKLFFVAQLWWPTLLKKYLALSQLPPPKVASWSLVRLSSLRKAERGTLYEMDSKYKANWKFTIAWRVFYMWFSFWWNIFWKRFEDNKNTLTGPANCKKTTRHHAHLSLCAQSKKTNDAKSRKWPKTSIWAIFWRFWGQISPNCKFFWKIGFIQIEGHI